jgi:ATP-binding cassette, subfamily C (CFTR/MRP), member 1
MDTTYYSKGKRNCTECFSGNVPVTLSPLITFIVYTIIAVMTKSETLLSSQAFASLSLISLATAPLIKFCQALPSFAQAAACFSRIEEFCLKDSALAEAACTNSSRLSQQDDISLRDMHTVPVGNDTHLMYFERADIAWNSASSPVLRNLALKLSQGLTAIAGPVASGKSTLLWTILGETALKAGSMGVPLARAAFCSQTPWIIDDTIRHNVTLGLKFDQEWYNFSIASSCLQGDLLAFPQGDMALAGANGSSLSGGQRQRVVSLTNHSC